MNICLWSGSSFEKWYSSYHLMEDLVLEVLKAGHELWLVQVQRGDGRLPSSFSEYNNLHVINIPQREPEKSNFIKRYTSSIDY